MSLRLPRVAGHLNWFTWSSRREAEGKQSERHQRSLGAVSCLALFSFISSYYRKITSIPLDSLLAVTLSPLSILLETNRPVFLIDTFHNLLYTKCKYISSSAYWIVIFLIKLKLGRHFEAKGVKSDIICSVKELQVF